MMEGLGTCLIAAAFLLTSCVHVNSQESCAISLDGENPSWPGYPPIITKGQDAQSFVYPVLVDGDGDNREILVAADEELNLACGGYGFEELDTTSDFARVRCAGGSQFAVLNEDGSAGEEYDFSRLGCRNQSIDYSVVRSGRLCGPNDIGQEILLGFDSTASDYIGTTLVCFDYERSTNLYSVHNLPREIVSRDHDNDRPWFKEDGHYDYDVNQYYTQAQQELTIAGLVGSAELAAEYVRPEEDFYLSRGHLSPNADYVYYAQQDSSFYFVNVAPQWMVFNGNNWFYIEDGLRDFIEARDTDLVVYSGTHGVSELRDVNGDFVEIWLHPEENGVRLPVPRFFWKVVVEPAAGAGVALVGVNNPYVEPEMVDLYRVCSSTVDDHPLLENVYYPDDIERGIVYACEIAVAREVIKEIPEELEDLQLLM